MAYHRIEEGMASAKYHSKRGWLSAKTAAAKKIGESSENRRLRT